MSKWKTTSPASGANSGGAARFTYRNKIYPSPVGLTVKDALRALGFEPEIMLVVLKGSLISDDYVLQAGDEFKLVAIVSGGSDTQLSQPCQL